MIELSYVNGAILVYDLDDWERLRKDYRIIGEFLGRTNFLPVLPLKLSPEEAYLLLDKNLATLVTYNDLDKPPDQKLKEQLEEGKSKLLNDLRASYKQSRKRQLETYIDKIVAGKRKKGDERSKEEILEEEASRNVEINEENMIYPIWLRSHPSVREKKTVIPKETLLEKTTPTRCEVFCDLWEKNYYITGGAKFGGDFLVYEGDPIGFHAVHIIRCVEDVNKPMHPTEIVAFGRLANSVKKKAILASIQEGKVSYLTLTWPHR